MLSSREKHPEVKISGLATGLGSDEDKLRILIRTGYILRTDPGRDAEFWSGCRGCVNYSIVESKNFRNCLCTAMLFDPERVAETEEEVSAVIVHH